MMRQRCLGERESDGSQLLADEEQTVEVFTAVGV